MIEWTMLHRYWITFVDLPDFSEWQLLASNAAIGPLRSLWNAVANKEHIERLHVVIQHLQGCDSKHVETAQVHGIFNGQTVWQGEVEVFDVTGHARAKRCYAWSFKDDAGKEHMTAVLAVPPVKSPADAVRVSIIADAKKRQGK